jgi:chitinase
VGSVPVGSRGPDLPQLPVGTYPAWSASATYVAGDVVLFDGLGYEAKWWTVSSSPALELDDPLGSPWKPLFVWPGEPVGGY